MKPKKRDRTKTNTKKNDEMDYIMTERQKRISRETFEELKTLFLEKNHFYTVLDVYFKPSGKQFIQWVLLQCNEHGGKPFEQVEQSARQMSTCRKCPKCLSILQTNSIRIPIPELNKRIQESTKSTVINKQVVIRYSNKLHNNSSVVLVKCNLFGHHKKLFPQPANSVGKNNVCPECIKTREYNKKAGENFIEKINTVLKEKNNSFSFFGSIDRNNKKIIFYELICKKCGCSEWEREKYVGSVKCKVCHPVGTKGESLVNHYLSSLNIVFETEKKYDDLKNIQNLEIDFYISKFNLLIEFDGIQHKQPCSRFEGIKGFFKTIKSDWKKNRYALKNDINLLRIPECEINNIGYHIDNALKKIYKGEKIYKINYTPIIVWRRRKHKEKKGRIVFFDYNRFKLQTINIISLSNDNRKTSFRKIQYSAGKFH